MRESRTFESWWQILCSMGQSMRFKSLILLHDNNGRNFNSQWNSTEKYENRGRTIELKIPLGLSDKSGFILRACIYVDDYLELSGHQVKLLTRLMDEFPMPHSHALTGGEHAQVQGTCGEPAAQETVSSHPKEETELTAAERDEDSDFAGSPASDGTLAGHEFLSDSLKIISLGLKHIFRQHK